MYKFNLYKIDPRFDSSIIVENINFISYTRGGCMTDEPKGFVL